MFDEYLNKINKKDDVIPFLELIYNDEIIKKAKEMNEFQNAILREMIRKKAVLVGKVKEWNKQEKKFCLEEKAQDESSKVYEHDGVSYSTGEWTITDAGVYRCISGVKQIAAYQPLIVTERRKNVKSKVEYLQITYKDEGEWKSAYIERKILSSNIKIIGLVDYGITVSPENSKILSIYINDFYNLNIDKIPVGISTSNLGWFIDDEHNFDTFLPYISNGITCDAEGDLKETMEYYHQKGTLEDWVNIVKPVRVNPKIRLYMAASFGSPLLKLLETNGYLVHIYGDRAKGKTVSLVLAMSIWGNPDQGKLTTSINNTKFAFEIKSQFLQNLPLAGDELQEMDKKDFNHDDLIYLIANGDGRTRGNKDKSIDATPTWKLSMLTTGEMPITADNSKSGSKVRCIEIENTQEMYPKGMDLPDFCGKIKSCYGSAGPEYIKGVIGLGRDKVRKLFNQAKSEMLEQSEAKIDSKQLNALSVLRLADKLAGMFIFKDEKELPVSFYLSYVREEEEINFSIRAREYVLGQIKRYPNNFDSDIEESDDRMKKEVCGKFLTRDNAILINLYSLNDYLAKFGTNYDSVKKIWKNHNFIATRIENNKERFTYYHKKYYTTVKLINVYTEEDYAESRSEEKPF